MTAAFPFLSDDALAHPAGAGTVRPGRRSRGMPRDTRSDARE